MGTPSARVVVFSYGDVAGDVIALVRELAAEATRLVVPTNRPAEATEAVRAAATAASVEVLEQPAAAEASAFARRLEQLRPDLFVVWHYSMLLPPEVLAVPRLGSVNVHGGLLPDYRGGHVLQWAILNGERETGVTLHMLDSGIDTGPVIATTRVPIEDGDDAATVSAKLRPAGLELLRENWDAIVSGAAAAEPQPPGGRYWPLRIPADGRIDWRDPPERIRNLVRALVAPWPGAFVELPAGRLVVDRGEVEPSGQGAAPGTVLAVESKRLVVAAEGGAVALTAARLDGRRVGFDELGLVQGDVLP